MLYNITVSAYSEVGDLMNIYDIAREAGVSIATISRVINGNSQVSKKTKEKVEEVLKKHNYAPNAIARGLVLKSMKTVGVLAIDIRDIYYANTAYTIEQELCKLGYNVILCNTGGDTSKKTKYINDLVEKNVDGIVLVGSVFRDKQIEKVICNASKHTPIVMVNCFIEAENIYSIICDDAHGISMCVDYLYSKGHIDIVYFQDTDTFSGRSKVKGFKDGLSKKNLKLKPYSILKVVKGLRGGYDGIEHLISNKYEFSAVVTGDDITAVGALKKLVELGKRIPQDVAVTGFDNSIIAQCCVPELTTVDGKMENMATGAVRILIDVLEGRNVPSKTLITPNLVIRKSS